MQITTRGATAADLDVVTELIARLNIEPTCRCLHAGERAEEIRQALLRLRPPFASTFTLAVGRGEKEGAQLHDGRLLGIVGADLDLAASRAWLWGPWVEHGFWSVVGGPLLDRLLWFVRELERVDAYADDAATRVVQLLESRGFEDPRRTHVYIARPPLSVVTGDDVSLLDERHESELLSLHRSLFPEETTGRELFDTRSDERPIFAVVAEDRLAGYLAASTEVDPPEALVRFVGVRPDARGGGIGKALLRRALRWALTERSLPQVALTVRDSNVNARALYEGLGFRLEYTGVHLRKNRVHPSP